MVKDNEEGRQCDSIKTGWHLMTQKTENLLPFKKTSGNQKCFKTIFKNSRDVFFFFSEGYT